MLLRCNNAIMNSSFERSIVNKNVRVQDLPLLPTSIVRGYDEDNAPLMADFQIVTTMQQVDAYAAWLHGMLGKGSRRIWRGIGEAAMERGIERLYMRRAPGRILPRGRPADPAEGHPEGTMVIDLREAMRRPFDTGFQPLE